MKLFFPPEREDLAKSFVAELTIASLNGKVDKLGYINFDADVLTPDSMAAIDVLLASETYENVISKAANQSAAGEQISACWSWV